MLDKNFIKRVATKEQGLNALQASLLAVPGLGSALERLLFGSIAEARMNRIEETLKEVLEKLVDRAESPPLDGNEDYARLIEDVIPSLGRSTNETKRKMFRDLLYNASKISSGDPHWEEANLIAKTIDDISYLGLEIVAAIHHCTRPNDNTCCIRWNQEVKLYEISLMRSDETFSLAQPFEDGAMIVQLADHSDFILNKTLMDLSELEVLSFGRDRGIYLNVFLQQFGEMIVAWTSDEKSADDSFTYKSSDVENPVVPENY